MMRDCRHLVQTLPSPTQKRRSVVRSLVAQGHVLEGELAMAAAEEREESKQVEQEGGHRAEILSGSAPTDQRLAAGRGFGEGQVAPASASTRGASRCASATWAGVILLATRSRFF